MIKIIVPMNRRFEILEKVPEQGGYVYESFDEIQGLEPGKAFQFWLNGEKHSSALCVKVVKPDHKTFKPRWRYEWTHLSESTWFCPNCGSSKYESRELHENGNLHHIKTCSQCQLQWGTLEIYIGIVNAQKCLPGSGPVEPVLLRKPEISRKKSRLSKAVSKGKSKSRKR